MHIFRILIRWTLWVVFLAVAFSASTLYHLDMNVGRRAGREIANQLVTSLIAGRLSIGRIDRLAPDRIVVRHASLYDRHGVRVIRADRIVLVLDLDSAMHGVLRFSHVGLDQATLRLDQDADGAITFLDALAGREVSTEPRQGEPFHAVVDDMRLHRVAAYGNLLGAHDLHASNLDVHMRMEFFHEMDIRIFGGRGRLDGPMDFVASLDDVAAHVSSDAYLGSTVDAHVHYQDQRLRAHMTYAVPRGQPEDGVPELNLQLEADPIDLQTVHRIGFDWASTFQGRGRGFVRLYGPPNDLRMSAALEHEGGPIVLHGELPSEGDVVIAANTTGIDLARLVPNTPSIVLGGSLELRVHPATTNQPATVHAGLHAFAYEGFAIPTLTLDATLLPDRVQIDSVEAPYGTGGNLNASGYAGYDGTMHVEFDGSLGDVRRDPNVQQFVPGARGRASLRGSVDRHDEVTTVIARGTLTDVAYSDVLASSVRFDVDARTHGDATRLRLEAQSRDLRVGPIMLGDGDASIRSQSGGYALVGSFYDPRVDGRTGVSGLLHTRGDTQVLDAPSLHYQRRGVDLVLRGNHVELAPHRTFVADHVELDIDGRTAARFDANWRGRGPDAGQLIFDHLPLASLSRLLSPVLPDLSGTFDGRAVLSGDLETDPRVDLRATIANGSVGALRGIEGQLSTLLDHGQLSGGLSLDAAEGGHVDLDLTGHAAITLPNFGTAVREGEYHFHTTMESIDVGRVSAGLLGVSDSGFGGCMDGTLDFGGYIAFAPTLDAQLSVGDLQIAGSPPIELALTSRYDGQNLEGTASVGADTTSQRSARRRSGRCEERARERLADEATFRQEGLAEAYASMRVPLVELFGSSEAFSSLLQLMPWGLSVRIPPREFATLPDAWLERLPDALRDYQGAGSLTALGGFGSVQASAAATLDYTGDTRNLICGENSRPRLSMWGTHVSGETRGRVFGFVGSERVLSAVVRTVLPIDEWLASGTFGDMPDTAVELAVTPVEYESLERGADVPTVESSHIPVLCEYFRGPFAGRASIDHLFTDHPTLGGSVFSDHMQVRRIERSSRGTIHNALEDSPEIPEIALKFDGDATELRFNHDMTWWGENRVTQMQGFVGWTWNSENVLPVVAANAPFSVTLDAPAEHAEGGAQTETPAPTNTCADGTSEPNACEGATPGTESDTEAEPNQTAEASAAEGSATDGEDPDGDARTSSSLPLQLITAWIPLFGHVEGTMDARVHAHGTLDAPVLGGQLHIRNGTVVLTGIGQRLRNVSGTIQLEEDGAYIDDLHARDGDGTVNVHGVIDLRGWTATGFDVRAEAVGFPVRDEGSIVARLRGEAGLNGTIGDDDVASELTIERLDVQLLSQGSRNPIELGDHPDVRIVGSTARREEAEDRYPLRIHIAQTPRFWVRSEDFAAEVSTELDVVYDSPETRISGELELHRGYFDVFGKRFEVDTGGMALDGSPTLDPIVTLVAHHQLSGGGRNDIVVVRATGTLSSPVVEFSSPLVSNGDQGQIICLLLTGNAGASCGQSSSAGGNAQNATTQATQFLTSVAFGMATLALRENLGDMFPNVSVETGSNSNYLPRVRAGFNAERLIPHALRNVVRGIYIEGYYNAAAGQAGQQTGNAGTSSSTSTSLNSTAGFSIEVQFPHNIVTEGEYSMPNNWRLGVTWEP